MTATEAKLESAWRSLPPIIRAKIERGTECGEWVPAMDSYIGVEGLQEETYVGKSGDTYTLMGRKFIGEYM